MGDTVTSQTIYDKDFISAFCFTNISDGTGEDNVTKIDASTLKGAANDGSERIDITAVAWTINNGKVNIEFDGSPEKTALVLSGSGSFLFDAPSLSMDAPISNSANGANGDIVFNTVNFEANSSYTVWMKTKKQAGFTGL